MSSPHAARPPHALDLRERGADRDGRPQASCRRLFVQLVALEAPRHPGLDGLVTQLASSLAAEPYGSVLYADIHHPLGLAVVAWAEEVELLATSFRTLLGAPHWPAELRIRPELSMMGRTYSSGFETDLEDWLLERPKRTLLDPDSNYAVWYPLRRKGSFERLEPREKGAIMAEHGSIGRAYGEQGLAHDVRLSCHGLDTNDNDFVIGLVGKELFSLSHVVSAMRKTRQTAEHMEKMGPFFVGKVLSRSAGQ